MSDRGGSGRGGGAPQQSDFERKQQIEQQKAAKEKQEKQKKEKQEKQQADQRAESKKSSGGKKGVQASPAESLFDKRGGKANAQREANASIDRSERNAKNQLGADKGVEQNDPTKKQSPENLFDRRGAAQGERGQINDQQRNNGNQKDADPAKNFNKGRPISIGDRTGMVSQNLSKYLTERGYNLTYNSSERLLDKRGQSGLNLSNDQTNSLFNEVINNREKLQQQIENFKQDRSNEQPNQTQERPQLSEKERVERNRVFNDRGVVGFAFDSSDLDADAYQDLKDSLPDSVYTNENISLILTAYSSNPGSPEYNYNLAQERAETLAEQLQEDGIKAQIEIHVIGEQEAPNFTDKPGSQQADNAEQRIVLVQINEYHPADGYDAEPINDHDPADGYDAEPTNDHNPADGYDTEQTTPDEDDTSIIMDFLEDNPGIGFIALDILEQLDKLPKWVPEGTASIGTVVDGALNTLNEILEAVGNGEDVDKAIGRELTEGTIEVEMKLLLSVIALAHDIAYSTGLIETDYFDKYMAPVGEIAHEALIEPASDFLAEGLYQVDTLVRKGYRILKKSLD